MDSGIIHVDNSGVFERVIEPLIETKSEVTVLFRVIELGRVIRNGEQNSICLQLKFVTVFSSYSGSLNRVISTDSLKVHWVTVFSSY